MPGYADPSDLTGATVIGYDSRDSLPLASAIGGYPTIEEIGDKTFYGWKLNPTTGELTIDKIESNDGDAVDLPKDNILRNNDYKVWVWTTSLLKFSWSGDHLYMEVNQWLRLLIQANFVLYLGAPILGQPLTN